MSSFLRLPLEDFGTAAPQTQLTAQPVEAPAPDTTEVYEKGYRAGWDDCLSGAKSEQKHIAEALGKRLGEAELSIEQTRDAVLGGLKPLMADVIQKLLPALAQAGFRQQLVDEIIDLAHTAASATVEVRVSYDDLAAVTALLEAHPEVPHVNITADPALGLTQAHIKLGSTGRSLDILNVVDSIETAFDAVLNTQKEVSHG
jgi:flagellar assembly protein FliH